MPSAMASGRDQRRRQHRVRQELLPVRLLSPRIVPRSRAARRQRTRTPSSRRSPLPAAPAPAAARAGGRARQQRAAGRADRQARDDARDGRDEGVRGRPDERREDTRPRDLIEKVAKPVDASTAPPASARRRGRAVRPRPLLDRSPCAACAEVSARAHGIAVAAPAAGDDQHGADRQRAGRDAHQRGPDHTDGRNQQESGSQHPDRRASGVGCVEPARGLAGAQLRSRRQPAHRKRKRRAERQRRHDQHGKTRSASRTAGNRLPGLPSR